MSKEQNAIHLNLDKIRIPFFYATTDEQFKFETIADNVKPATFERDKTVTSLAFNIESDSKTLQTIANVCFSLNRMVIAMRVVSVTSKSNHQGFTTDEVKKYQTNISEPVISKIIQLISVQTEQMSGVPILVDIADNAN